MSLTDVYCRINRARGLELLSPEDLLNSCRLMKTLNLPLKLFEFDSGVKVLQLESLRDESVAESTLELVNNTLKTFSTFVSFLFVLSWKKEVQLHLKN